MNPEEQISTDTTTQEGTTTETTTGATTEEGATTETTTGATTEEGTTTETTTETTTTATETQEVMLTQQQYEEMKQMKHDSMMIENILLTLLIGMFLGFIGIKGLFDAWKA
jgi:hypothetical protein